MGGGEGVGTALLAHGHFKGVRTYEFFLALRSYYSVPRKKEQPQ